MENSIEQYFLEIEKLKERSKFINLKLGNIFETYDHAFAFLTRTNNNISTDIFTDHYVRNKMTNFLLKNIASFIELGTLNGYSADEEAILKKHVHVNIDELIFELQKIYADQPEYHTSEFDFESMVELLVVDPLLTKYFSKEKNATTKIIANHFKTNFIAPLPVLATIYEYIRLVNSGDETPTVSSIFGEKYSSQWTDKDAEVTIFLFLNYFSRKKSQQEIQHTTKKEHEELLDMMEQFRDNDDPYVGIFWLNPKRMELFGIDKIEASHAPVVAGKKSIRKLHQDFWAKKYYRAVAANAKESIYFEYKNYTLIPRGRIFQFVEDGRFEVFVGNWIKDYNESKIRELIEDEFNLTDFEFHIDEHWDIGRGWSERGF